VPYRVYGSISFYQRKEIKDMISYLRVLINPRDDEAFKRIINYPARGIGKTTLEKLEQTANSQNISLWDVLQHISEFSSSFNRGTLEKLAKFSTLIIEYQKKSAEEDAFVVADFVAKTTGIYKELYNGNTPEEMSKFENLQELLNGIKDFSEAAREEGESSSLQNYLEDVALLTDADNETEQDRNKVKIMTAHSAKGLEFSQVFVAGAEDELFPSHMALENPRDLEEERRLFYVAVTRAKKKVTISYSQSRYRWGELTDCSPSRFIKEISDEYIDWPDDPRKTPENIFGDVLFPDNRTISHTKARPETLFNRKLTRITPGTFTGKPVPVPSDSSFKSSDPASIQSGMIVEHQRFGKGKVVHIEGDMPNKKATVFFQQMKQEKQLLLKFAKLRIVDEI
jgi:DNA helicase-2/ATP-dependent DNA helicase PcrA